MTDKEFSRELYVCEMNKHDDGQYHFIPLDDVFSHQRSESCFCGTTIEFCVKQGRTVVHRRVTRELRH